MTSFVLMSVNNMFAPTISSLYHKGELEKLAGLYKSLTKWIISINLVAFALILLLSKEILWLFGPEFIVGSYALILVSIGQVVNSSVGSAGYILTMTGFPKVALYINIFSAGINIVLNFFLIPAFGIVGAATASLISIGIANILRLIFVFKKYKIHPYDKKVIIIVAIIVGDYLILYFLKKIVVTNNVAELIVFTVIFLIIFISCYKYFILSSDDKIIINAFMKKVKLDKLIQNK